MQRIRSAQHVLEHEETSVIAPMCKWKKEKGEGGNRRKMGTNILKRTVIRGEDATNKDGTNDRACKWVVHLAQLVEICFIRRLNLSFRSDFRSSHKVSWYVERVRSPCTRVTITLFMVQIAPWRLRLLFIADANHCPVFYASLSAGMYKAHALVACWNNVSPIDVAVYFIVQACIQMHKIFITDWSKKNIGKGSH